MADKTAIMKEAQKFLARGQLDKAIAEWDKLIRESPDGNTYNTVGDLYLKKGDRKNAIESYHKAAGYFRQEGFSLKALALYKKVLNISQTDADALYALGELSEEKGLTTDATKYYLAVADSLSKEGKKDRLLDVYQKILSLSPSNVPLRIKVAEIFLKEGLQSDAIKEYLSIAGTYEEKDDIAKAKEYYRKVIELQPTSKEAAIGMARLYKRSGEVAKAVAAMKEMADLFPEDTDILFRYADLSLEAGGDDTAEGCLRKVLEIEPANIRALRLLGDLFLNGGLREKAWEFYLPVIDEMIIQEHYDDPIRLLASFREIDPLEAGRRLVSLYRKKGDHRLLAAELVSLGGALKEKGLTDDAIGCYREALEADPEDARARELIAELEAAPAADAGYPEAESGPHTEEEAISADVSAGEKPVEELLTEADVFSRYGLLNEAIKLLESLKSRDPQNADVHLRLKSLYAETADKESAVTECLVLSEIYKRQGDPEGAEKMLREAAGIYPEDPRLAERGVIPQLEPTSYAAEPPAFGEAEVAPDIEDYEEEIAEADFYVRQGLSAEASKILEKLHTLFPENKEVADRLTNLGQLSEVEETPEMPTLDLENEGEEELPTNTAVGTEENVLTAATEIEMQEESQSEEEPAGEEAPEGGFEDFAFSEQDLVDAQEMPQPELENDVLEIFQEFKKGLEKELGDEDSETHYNLGIAYKEMGLVDDAIKEFQTSRNDSKRFLQSSTMLAVCYMEKGMYSLVIDVLGKVLAQLTDRDESFWSVKYDIAEAHEKNNNLKEAFSLYTEVFGWNAKFRGVSEKVSQIGAQLGKDNDGEKPKPKKDRVSYL